MSVAAQPASDTLHLSHHYDASPERVFEAWTDARQLGKWFGPHSHRCEVEKFDAREGGEYQIRLIPVGEDSDCGGDTDQPSVCAGTFVEISAPERIAMTFSWVENGADIGETLLTIELSSANGGTNLVLTHERLPNEQMRAAHQGGWQGSLECLEEFLAAA